MPVVLASSAIVFTLGCDGPLSCGKCACPQIAIMLSGAFMLCRDRLRVDPTEYAVLAAEANVVPRAVRERVCEIMFEKLKVPALFLAKNAVRWGWRVPRLW